MTPSSVIIAVLNVQGILNVETLYTSRAIGVKSTSRKWNDYREEDKIMYRWCCYYPFLVSYQRAGNEELLKHGGRDTAGRR